LIDIKLFSGNANGALAKSVSKHLDIPLGNIDVGRFSDGEIMVEVLENVRGRDVFILQSTCAPINDMLMELIIMADAMRRASAASITAVVPYFGYARQDRRVRSARVPITAKVVADMMASVGITRLITMDLHADQIQGFFYMPVDNVYASKVMLDDIKQQDFHDLLLVSPDVGGVVRARAMAKRLNDADLAIIDKRRSQRNQSKVMNVIGDVQDRDCILVDDMVDTAGTLCHAAQALKARGARRVVAYCTHPVLSGDAVGNIEASQIDDLVVADTIPLTEQAQQSSKIRCLGVGQLLAETIYRVNHRESVSSMFVDESGEGMDS
jgi:ribose-phosphate pyrophosphokinase